jgi:hypothetical protein
LSRRLAALASLGLLAWASAAGVHGEDPDAFPFRRYDLQVGGRITEVLPVDLDGDQREDLLVVRGREALVFFQGKDGSWPRRASQRFRFHPRTVLFDVGDVDGDGLAEVVLLQAGQVRAYRLRQRPNGRLLYGLRTEVLVDVETFLERPVEDEVRRKELLRDLDGDGDRDLLVPVRDGFSLLRNDGQGGFEPPTRLPTPPVAHLHPGRDRLSSQLSASYWFPNPILGQWDDGAELELVVAREALLEVFRPQGGERLQIERLGSWEIPDQKQLSLNVENPFELDFNTPLIVRDLDGDARIDVSSTHVGQGITRIYRNLGDPAEAFREPVQSIRAKGVTVLSFYNDLDGDGRADLVLPRMDEVSAWSVLKVLITRSVPVEVQIYYQRPDSAEMFPDEPDVVREIEVGVSLNSRGQGIKLGSSIVANFGDFDGDGRKDFLYRTGPEELSLYRGLAGRTVAEEASGVVTIPNVGDYRFCLARVRDLDADGRHDVVLRYTSWDRKEDAITVLSAGR